MNTYDYLVLGAGWGGLCAASLLAKAGHRVAVLETQERVGGCGQSFALGDFTFCAEMQYLMECHPGGVVHRWIDALGLLGEVQFNAFDVDGYDRIEMPGYGFRIPHNAGRFEKALCAEFPTETKGIGQLFTVMRGIHTESEGAPFEAKRFLENPFQYKDTLLYGPWPVSRVLDHFSLSPRLQMVLAGQCGDVGLPPSEEPFLCLQSVLFGYCESAHFPKQGMGHFLDRIVDSIKENGGEIFLKTPVTGIGRDGDRVTHVETPQGPFAGNTVISNIDPARTLAMIDGAAAPGYQQCGSTFTIFLGLNVDLAQQGFGRCNVWNYPDENIDAAIKRTITTHDYKDPFFFLSTPSLCADPGVLAPAGGTTVQINVASDFNFFDAAVQQGTHETERARVCGEILAAVERRLLPNLTKHIVVQEAWSPVDLAQRTGLVRGGMYGARLDFQNRIFHRVSQTTAYNNLFLTGATAGSPGLQGVVASSTRLVELLLIPEAKA